MGVNIFLILFLMFFSSCEKEVAVPSKSDKNVIKVEFSDDIEPEVRTTKTTLYPSSGKVQRFERQWLKPLMFKPQIFGHSKLLWVPISYYEPIKDNTNAQLRLMVPMIFDPDYGMVQPTTLNILETDSFELDGNNLIFYSDQGAKITSFTPNEGENLLAPYTDTTVVMIVYRDSSLSIIPNARYSTAMLNVPEKEIMGFYFALTDYYQY